MKKLLEIAKREPALVTLVILVMSGVLFFTMFANSVSQGHSREFDEWAILALRTAENSADPLGPPWFEEVIRDLTALGGYAVVTTLTLAVVIYLCFRNRYRIAVFVLTAVIGGVLLSTILKTAYNRPRPNLVPHEAIVYSKSFPSGHAMLSATTYLTLGAMLAEAEKTRRLKLYFLVLGILLTVVVGISRVYLGVHWPSDVLAGWAAGGTWTLICWSVAHVVERQERLRNIKSAE